MPATIVLEIIRCVHSIYVRTLIILRIYRLEKKKTEEKKIRDMKFETQTNIFNYFHFGCWLHFKGENIIEEEPMDSY